MFLLSLAQLSNWTYIVGEKFSQSKAHSGILAMNPSMHLLHPTPPHIEVSIQHSYITILKSMHAVSQDHANTVQMTQWDGFNPLDTN